MPDLAGDDGEPVARNSTNLGLIPLERVLDVDEVGVEGALISGMYHPEYEQ